MTIGLDTPPYPYLSRIPSKRKSRKLLAFPNLNRILFSFEFFPPFSTTLRVHAAVSLFWNRFTNQERGHSSPIYDECHTQSAKVLTLLWKRAHQDNSNDTPQPISEF